MLILMLTTMTMTIEKISQKSDPSMTFFGEISLNPFEVFLTISIVLIQHNQLKSLKVGCKTATISQMKPPSQKPPESQKSPRPWWPRASEETSFFTTPAKWPLATLHTPATWQVILGTKIGMIWWN